MAGFVHLTPARTARRIVRAGTRAGLWCMPRLPSYSLTHQWVRELRRWNPGVLVAVDLRIPDDEPVTAGRFDHDPGEMTAAEAVALIRGLEDPRGFEVRIPRPLGAGAVRRVREIRQGIGWRHQPDAHGRRPCVCPLCLGFGTPGSGRVRRRFDRDGPRSTKPELMAALHAATDPIDIACILGELGSRSRGGAEELTFLAEQSDPEVREALVETLERYRGPAARDLRLRVAATLPALDRE